MTPHHATDQNREYGTLHERKMPSGKNRSRTLTAPNAVFGLYVFHREAPAPAHLGAVLWGCFSISYQISLWASLVLKVIRGYKGLLQTR